MKTKISPELFLEKSELDRFERGLRDEGFVQSSQLDAMGWGIIRNQTLDPNFDYFEIVKTADLDKIRIKNGIALDKDRLALNWQRESEDLVIPQINTPYWIKISHEYEPAEVGKVSIGSVGNGALMTGVDTKFTEVLRGQPNFSSKIRFKNSSNYNLEYEVLEVIDDNNVLVQGIFNVLESDLEYIVIGTFTAGHQPLTADKEIFQYDSCKITFVQDTGSFPTLIDGKEFLIGRVEYDNAITTIQDYRFLSFYESADRNLVDDITTDNVKLVGLEYIKQLAVNGRVSYVVGYDFKFNITSETQNNGLNVVAISSGYGGAWKSTQPFSNGDWDGWRYYYADGHYSTVLASVMQGTGTILLSLDSVRIGSGAGTFVTPNCEDVEIYASFMADGSDDVIFTKPVFNSITMKSPTLIINQDEVFTSNQRVELFYVLKNNFRRSQRRGFNQSTYYNTGAYTGGVLTNPGSVTISAYLYIGNVMNSSNSFVPPRVAMAWHPTNWTEITVKFDSTGLGVSGFEFIGWAVCNGNNNTPDYRGRSPIGINNPQQLPSSSPAYDSNVDPTNIDNKNLQLDDTGGVFKHKISIAEMPVHDHGGATPAGGDHQHKISEAQCRTDDDETGANHKAMQSIPPQGQTGQAYTSYSAMGGGSHAHPIAGQGGSQKHETTHPIIGGIWIMKIV